MDLNYAAPSNNYYSGPSSSWCSSNSGGWSSNGYYSTPSSSWANSGWSSSWSSSVTIPSQGHGAPGPEWRTSQPQEQNPSAPQTQPHPQNMRVQPQVQTQLQRLMAQEPSTQSQQPELSKGQIEEFLNILHGQKNTVKALTQTRVVNLYVPTTYGDPIRLFRCEHTREKICTHCAVWHALENPATFCSTKALLLDRVKSRRREREEAKRVAQDFPVRLRLGHFTPTHLNSFLNRIYL